MLHVLLLIIINVVLHFRPESMIHDPSKEVIIIIDDSHGENPSLWRKGSWEVELAVSERRKYVVVLWGVTAEPR